MSSPAIHGTCHPHYRRVEQAFARNLREETGAAVCCMVHGEVVVDLWAGDAAPGQPWEPDTLATVFSTTKGVVATAFL